MTPSQDIQSRRDGMVIVKPLKLLVCLCVLSLTLITAATVTVSWAYGDISGSTVIQGDALSAEPRINQQYRSKAPVRTQQSAVSSGYTARRSYYSAPPMAYPGNPSQGAICPPGNPGPGSAFGPVPQGGGLSNFFGLQGFGYGQCGPPPFLPRMGCSKFQLNAKIWYSNLNSSTIVWGSNAIGGEAPQLSLTKNLGLRQYEYLSEYEGQCQVKSNWGIRVSFMPIRYRDNFIPSQMFFYGNILYPAFVSTLTIWDRNIYRAALVYDWFKQPHAIASLFAGYTLVDDKLTVSNPIQTRTRNRAAHLATAGVSFERFVRYLGTSVASINCKWSIDFLEGHLGWDGYAAGRISVPMNYGRYGYIEAGWRWVVLEIDQPCNVNKISLEGAMAAVGIIF